MKNKWNVLLVLSLLLSSVGFAADQVTLTKDNTLSLNDEFTEPSVSNLIKKAKDLDSRTQSQDPIYLVLKSPGGEIDAGLELIEDLSNLKRPVHTISIFSASMGFQTVQGLGDRLVLKNGTLMSHKARGGFGGEFPGQLDSRYSYYLKRVIRMDEQAVKRTKGKHTLKSYHDLVENEYWCDGQDCVDQGFADRVITSHCDKSLEGVHRDTIFEFLFMGMAVQIVGTYDNCPLNSGILKVDVLLDGKSLFPDNKEAPAAPTTTKSTDPYAELWSSFSKMSTSSIPSGLSRDDLFELQQKVKAAVDKRTHMQVIKSY